MCLGLHAQKMFGKVGRKDFYYCYYYYYYYNMHQLYFCYGKVELLRRSFLNYGAMKFPSAAEYVPKSYFLGN